jgi:hypothetical protein
MNRIAAVALILSLSCAGGAAFAGAMTPKAGDIVAVSSATDYSVIQIKDKSKGKTTTAPAATPAPKPKPVAPRPSLYSGPDFDNVLGLGNYFFTR